MSELPGNRIPIEALPEGGTSTPAGDAKFSPVWCWHPEDGIDSPPWRWSWVPDVQGWLCDDPSHFTDDPATTVGAIDAGHQPVFGNPPNKKQRDALTAAYVNAVIEDDREQRRGPWWKL